ncbi:unnamed protein product [Lactuca saligna]|uniref:Uncharacterized protein n=1 Tax=Lactuca saligna TaxID=75948 RepID=A0AA36EA49_LACSI|nr:unnamed protein product [Lactuca saligna]
MLIPYISHTTNKPGTRAYVICGRVGAQLTLSKEFDRLQQLKVLEIENFSQDSMQIPSTLEPFDTPADHVEEDDPEEDPEEEDFDDTKEDEDSDDEGIFQDTKEIIDNGPIEDEDDHADEEPAPPTPPVSLPRLHYQPYLLRGKGPWVMRTLGTSISPVYHLDPVVPVSQPTCRQLEKQKFPSESDWFLDLFRGKRDDQTGDRVGSLESFVRDSGSTYLGHRVKILEEGKKEDSDAIQKIYHRSGANCTEGKDVLFRTRRFISQFVSCRSLFFGNSCHQDELSP